MLKESVRLQIEAELSKGEAARTNGNEGMARVCARRAAGLLVRNYLTNQHIPFPNGTAYDLLKFYRDNPEISTEIQQVLDHLIARVDTEHNLPDNVDLIKETRWLIQALMQ